MNMELPQGDAIGLLPSAKYNVAGLFLWSPLLYQFREMIYDKFGYQLPIKYLYGAPKLKWNGGRLNLHNAASDFSIQNVKSELYAARENDITPLLTFSNSLITEEDLSDKNGNAALQLLDEVKGAAIVTSPLLKDYIAERYPDMPLHASVILTSYRNCRDVAYYKGLSDEYDHYVIHPDDNFNAQLLKECPKHNAEILLNERCSYDCALRRLHYESVCVEQKDQVDGHYRDRKFLNICNALPEHKQLKTKWRNLSFAVSELRVINDMGYTLFKIQGRTDSPFLFFFDLMRYTLEPDIAFPTAYVVFIF